jgi:RNA polymerase sigma-70 factor, ECF subfamily
MPDSQNTDEQQDARYEAYVGLFARHEAELRRFLASFIPSWGDVDELVQRTAIAIWRKFDQFDTDTNFMKWACVVARFEALAFRRKVARDRLVFREDVLDLMAGEAEEEFAGRSAEHEALETCLLQMPEKQRKFVMLAYTPGVKITEMAEEAGSSAAAFYMRLKRLRHQLMKCVEDKTLQNPEAG